MQDQPANDALEARQRGTDSGKETEAQTVRQEGKQEGGQGGGKCWVDRAPEGG